MLEHAAFGVSHDRSVPRFARAGALAAPAVASVRFHVVVHATLGFLADAGQRRALCALSALAHALMTDPETVDEVARKVAPQAGLDALLVQRARAACRSRSRPRSRARKNGRSVGWPRPPARRRSATLVERGPGIRAPDESLIGCGRR